MSDRLEVLLTLAVRPRVDDLTLGEEDETVEEGDDVGPRLVDGEDDGSVVVASEGDKGLNDVEGVEGVEACDKGKGSSSRTSKAVASGSLTAGRLIEEQNRGGRDELAGDGDSTLLSSRDRPPTCKNERQAKSADEG